MNVDVTENTTMIMHTPTAAHEPSRLAVSPGEAARLLGIGRTRLYEEIGSGALPSFRLGRRRLIRMAAIEAWLLAQESNASE